MAKKKVALGTPVSKPRKAKLARTKASIPEKFYQFRISLVGSKPPIWRRIVVEDCTLDTLHDFLRSTIGWSSDQLYEFGINGNRYGDPEMLNEECEDATSTMVSEIGPESCKQFCFTYEFESESWEHEVRFEGCPTSVPGNKLPLCLEGECACPPENVGGLPGYARFLKVLADTKHARHKQCLKWSGGPFDPAKFDAAEATKAMRGGLPRWQIEGRPPLSQILD